MNNHFSSTKKLGKMVTFTHEGVLTEGFCAKIKTHKVKSDIATVITTSGDQLQIEAYRLTLKGRN